MLQHDKYLEWCVEDATQEEKERRQTRKDHRNISNNMIFISSYPLDVFYSSITHT